MICPSRQPFASFMSFPEWAGGWTELRISSFPCFIFKVSACASPHPHTERRRASSEAAQEVTLRQTKHEESKNFTTAASEMQTPPSSFPSSKKHLVFQKQSVSADVQLWPVLLLWCLRSVIIFESLCSMADGLFLVALNLQNTNRTIIKCGAVEARCYVHANEGSTTNNVQHVGKSRCWRNGLILF